MNKIVYIIMIQKNSRKVDCLINSNYTSWVMTYCRNCGKEAMAEDKFCQFCGLSLGQLIEAQEKPKETHASATSSESVRVDARYSSDHKDTSISFKDGRNAKFIALIGGFFGLCGLGHIYIGQRSKGVGILAVGLALSVFSTYSLLTGNINIGMAVFVIYIPLWIWQIIDVGQKASEFNRVLHDTGKSAW